jgi:chromosome segregation ATPase
MSNRQPGSGPVDFAAYRQDDERNRNDARLGAIQSQVDELQQFLRELATRQTRVEEELKHSEGSSAQNRLILEQIRQEMQQSLQARALDENRTRQQLSDLEMRVDDATRPIRSLQAHVTELLELSRRKTDDTGQYQKRFEDLRGMIEHVGSVGDRNAVMVHHLRDALDGLREQTDQIRRDILRTDDSVKIVDQEARRRFTEVVQASEDVGTRIDELRSDLTHAFDLIDENKRSVLHVDPALAELREVDGKVQGDLTRLQSQVVERHDATIDLYEDLRQTFDAHVVELRQAQEQRYERLAERIEAVADHYRELGYQISAVALQLDELRQIDQALRRDLWQIHEQRVRLRLEQVQHELDVVTGQRRDAEGGPGGARAESRTTDY